MARRTASLACLYGILLLAGCGTGVFIQKDPARDALADLRPGFSRLEEVVAVLGEPLISFPDRGVAVFQREGELVDVLLPGIPYTTGWTYYTLVSFDDSGRLTGIDSGGYVYRTFLKADRFRYRMGYPGFLMEHEREPAYRLSGEGCSLVVAVVGDRWSDALFYKDPIELNGQAMQLEYDYSSYSYWSVEPGTQSLAVTWGTRRGPVRREYGFDCPDGALRYVILESDRKGEEIVVAEKLPALLEGRWLVLYPPITGAPSTAADSE